MYKITVAEIVKAESPPGIESEKEIIRLLHTVDDLDMDRVSKAIAEAIKPKRVRKSTKKTEGE